MIKITDRALLDTLEANFLASRYRTAFLFGGDPMEKADWTAMLAAATSNSNSSIAYARDLVSQMAAIGRPVLGYIMMPAFKTIMTDKKKFLIPCSQTDSLLTFVQTGVCNSLILTASSSNNVPTSTIGDLYTIIVGKVGDVDSGEDFELGQREIINNFEYRMNDITIKI